MLYSTPELTLVGAAQNVVLDNSGPKIDIEELECLRLDAGGDPYFVDENGW
jgi:hypothetical protein